MRSDLVVISWWSNCLGLACLHNLVNYTRNRNIYFIQVGKLEEQKERFRAHLPPGVKELSYPPDRSAEDWRVRETVARELLGDCAGLWFIDHDLFVQEDCEGWLDDMDRRFSQSNVCLCHPSPVRGPSITNPAFWLSPVRFPPGMPSFARLPYEEEPVASRPYALRQSAALIMPEKDTLVAAMEFLQERGMACGFPLTERDRVAGGPTPFPRCEHIGGLYIFTGEIPPEPLHDWVARCVERFTAFYEACSQEWVEAEDPVVLQRLEEFQEVISSKKASNVSLNLSSEAYAQAASGMGAGEDRMRSHLVVISWWSNCLGLACLYNLVKYTRNRNIYVIQVGKPEEQKERFRAYLPAAVEELPYPQNRGAEHWRVLETVAHELLSNRAGLWFIDHDVFVQEDCESWLDDMDQRFSQSNVCLSHRSPLRGLAMTNPAFWLSPVRFPPGLPSFAPVPYRENVVASRPYALRQSADLIMIVQEKETLVAAMEFLRDRGMVYEFPVTDSDRGAGGPAPFPSYEHLGGLYNLAGGVLPEAFHDWMAHFVERFTAFYAVCPPALVGIEDPVLMQRLDECRQAISRGV